MVVSSDAPSKNLREEETAIAPLRGASPPRTESASEQEESPMATDCTSLTLVNAVQDESASLVDEKQDSGVEPETLHEDPTSAAPAVSNSENSLTQGQAQQSQRASLRDAQGTLTAKNSVLGDEDKANHEDDYSAAPAPHIEKWSSEAIAARAKARPWRMEKIKMAGVLKENPGFEFLLECWNDDPALQIVIKKLVAKFPQWCIACVDGVLMKWNE